MTVTNGQLPRGIELRCNDPIIRPRDSADRISSESSPSRSSGAREVSYFAWPSKRLLPAVALACKSARRGPSEHTV
jgi:hypothetical protein